MGQRTPQLSIAVGTPVTYIGFGHQATFLSASSLLGGLDVMHRRLAGVAAVYAIAMTDTFVSDFKGHS